MSIALDVAIGVVFLYLLLALIVTTVQELVASSFRLRARHLYDAIAGMLEGTQQTPPEGQSKDPNKPDQPLRELFEHSLIRNLTDQAIEGTGLPSGWRRNRGLPSYIPSKTFALALIDVLRGKKTPTQTVNVSPLLADAKQAIENLPANSQARKALELLLKDVQTITSDVDKQTKLVSERIEGWFNDRMARASGWYKRKAQVWSLIIAGVVTLLANADTVYVVSRLWGDAALRTAVAAGAQKFVALQAQAPAPASAPQPGDDPVAEARAKAAQTLEQAKLLEDSQLPIGWHWLAATADKSAQPALCARPEPGEDKARCWTADPSDYALLFAGWLITTLAVSLGAGFWFDVLSRVLSLRGSGPRVSETDGKVETS